MLRRARAVLESSVDGREAFPVPDLILGDFNTPRGSESLEALVGAKREVLAEGGWGPRATWPRRLPLWGIDLGFVGDGWRVLVGRVLDPGAGGHRALEFEISR